MPGNIGRMGGNFVGNNAVLHIFFVRQSEMLFWRDVAQHRRTVPADHGRADGAGDVVVAGRDISHQWTQGIERSGVAEFHFFLHLLLDLVQLYMPRTFNHGLHVGLPRDRGQLAESLQLRKLRFIAGIGQASGTQSIAE